MALLRLVDLPTEIFAIVVENMQTTDISRLSRTCRLFYDFITRTGWTLHYRRQPSHAFSLTCTESKWNALDRIRYDHTSKLNWGRKQFVSRPILNRWRGKLMPVMAISETRLVVGAGTKLYVFKFVLQGSPSLVPENTFDLDEDHPGPRDITDIVFLPDGGMDCTLCVSFCNGIISKVVLPRKSSSSTFHMEALFVEPDDTVESLSTTGNLLLHLTSTGKTRLTNLASATPSTASSILQLGTTKNWTTHLSCGSTKYAAFGTSGANPLTIHSILESGISATPTAILGKAKSDSPPPTATGRSPFSAVYDIINPPPSFPGAPGQILIAGWYDGFVRIYDLRSSKRLKNDSSDPNAIPSYAPVRSLCDPLALDSIYAVSAGGPSGYNLAAGSSNHSIVSFWDIRQTKERGAGWSVYAPGNDRSPLYALIMDSSRVYGATQSRAFVLDFGPDVFGEMYPPIHDAGLKKSRPGDAGYYCTMYDHRPERQA